MAEDAARDIYNLPLAELTAAELHRRGIDRLSQSMAKRDMAEGAAWAAQAQALFLAALSARDVTAERQPQHRASSNPPPEGTGYPQSRAELDAQLGRHKKDCRECTTDQAGRQHKCPERLAIESCLQDLAAAGL